MTDPINNQPLNTAAMAFSSSAQPDGIVDGTDGDDYMVPGYVDHQGDVVDGADGVNDWINAGAGNDTVNGGAGNDTIEGGEGDDLLRGNAGHDIIRGDAGNDTINGDAGNDTIEGGEGDDLLRGDAGDDVLRGGEGNDTFNGGIGNDTIEGEEGDDLLRGDDGDDLLLGGVGSDTLNGGLGNDTLDGGDDDDLLRGDDGNDLLLGGAGNDTLNGGNGDDTLEGGEGDDLLRGDAGHDLLQGGAGNDTLEGGQGNDVLEGGDGDDSLIGGPGADTMTGGAGNDRFVVSGGGDLITDFDAVTGIGDGQSDNNDFVDLSAFYNGTTLAAWNAANPHQTYASPESWMQADQADGVLDAVGGLRIQDGTGNSVLGSQLTTENTGVLCFLRGTLIKTADGEVPVEQLEPGTKVMTLDHGCKALRWIGKRVLSAEELAAQPKLRPIRIRAEALGERLPERDLIVSPQHRVLLRSVVARRMVGEAEVLLAARHLIGLDGIEVVEDMQEVEYWHFMFDRHEVVFSNGAPTESLFTGPEAMKALGPEARHEILTLFPQLAQPAPQQPAAARLLMRGRQGRHLVQRLVANGKQPFSWGKVG
ncbi:Hint domain-containing protein [Paracoccus sp. SSJ]|uniref:Hint domain-containing protein n=1 Tax=Paracoccus sp. SSJ TaxID=3050636 RepID=UPI00254FDA2D|nr:Hint domain-containing protein [Paracoccus sp. SSJ]MDK8874275.1 Hint domain-containing protein [Paracoccus sp. SSJ]